MKNLIYQVYSGTLSEECRVSSRLMKQYANRIGAEYWLHIDPNIASKKVDSNGPYWEWLNPVIDDKFLEYDNVLVVDLDIFPVEGLKENIFEQEIGDIGICTEPFQGKYRSTVTVAGHINGQNDEKWARVIKEKWGVSLPRDSDGYLKVFNAGMVVFSNEGMKKARKWTSFQEYINLIRNKGFGRFYWVDQNYIHAMMCVNKDINYIEMDNGWNSQIHYVRGPMALTTPINDERTLNTKFVHVQMTAMRWNEKTLHQVVNKPQSQWEFL